MNTKPRIPVPALLIEGKADETAQGAADVALTYETPVPEAVNSIKTV